LPESQRDAIRAHVVDEKSYAELAAEFGVPEGTVRQRVSRGLARLRMTLEGRET
jgi:RNA polymerase sigma-70 factor (ECF subfamily)